MPGASGESDENFPFRNSMTVPQQHSLLGETDIVPETRSSKVQGSQPNAPQLGSKPEPSILGPSSKGAALPPSNSANNKSKKEVYKPPASTTDFVRNSQSLPPRKKSTYVPPTPIGGRDTESSKGSQSVPTSGEKEPAAAQSSEGSEYSKLLRNSAASTREESDTQSPDRSHLQLPSEPTVSAKTQRRSVTAAAADAAARTKQAKISATGRVEGDEGSLGSLDFEGESLPPGADPASSNSNDVLKLGGDLGVSSRINVDEFEDLSGLVVDEVQNPEITEESVDFGIMDPPARNSIDAGATPEPSSESGMRFDELYRLKGVLGTGAFSTVREGFHRSNTGVSFAVKCINRKKLSEEDEAALLDEVGILKEMKHIHIIRLYDFFDEPSTYYLVMERMRGGELFDRIVAKAYYNEKEARDTCKIIVEAVGYCHLNHVAHRDLKPENLLLLSEDDDTSVKIADFGFAKRVYDHNSLKTQCGTPGYVAPEILEGTPYDERADMWSVGVILYILLGGYPPFIESTQRDLFRKIRKGDYEFHEEYWGTVSAEAKELISSLLTVDANQRMTAEEGLNNPWITGDDAKLAQKDLGVNLDKLRNFNAKRKFRAAVSTVVAVNRLQEVSNSFFRNLKET